MKFMRNLQVGCITFFALGVGVAHAKLKPYVLAYTTPAPMAAAVKQVEKKLQGAGFQIVGSYMPYQQATVIAFTNSALEKAAAQTKFGGYGAVLRASVTQPWKPKNGHTIVPESGPLQVAYTNPPYWENAFRWSQSAIATSQTVATELDKALGHQSEFGSYNDYKNGISAEDLRGYHYMFGMEYFTDPSTLADYGSYQQAVSAVAHGLAQHAGGTTKVYEVKIPGKDQTVFGVGLTANNCSGDKYIMSRIDHGKRHNTPYAPYEILVAHTGKVYALYGRFRIAIAWLGLPMMESSTGATFFNIMCAPNAIEKALTKASGGND